MRRRGAITQPSVSLSNVATHPFASAADADAGGLGRRRQRPLPINHSQTELATAFQTERRVSVQIHPVSSLLGLRCLAALSLQGGPDGPTYSGTTPRYLAVSARDSRALLCDRRDPSAAPPGDSRARATGAWALLSRERSRTAVASASRSCRSRTGRPARACRPGGAWDICLQPRGPGLAFPLASGCRAKEEAHGPSGLRETLPE